MVEELPVCAEPALSGNNAPIHDESVFEDMAVIGTVPLDLNGLYVRNGPNAQFVAEGRYHVYDGDGMLHAVRFEHGRVICRNRWIETRGLQEERAAGRALWRGLKEPMRDERPDEPLKNTANTDVKYHAGRLIAMWYRSGLAYALDPVTLETVGLADCDGAVPRLSAHSRPDEHTGELVWFDYGLEPWFDYGVVGPDRKLRHRTRIALPAPSLPHDMAVTEHYTILHDFPLRPDAEALAAGRYKVRFHADQPSRFGVLPRHGSADQICWFEAAPTYMLHVVNAWEEGNEVVMVGTPYRTETGPDGLPDARALEALIRRRGRSFLLREWRFDLETGRTRERDIDRTLNTEFPVINSLYQGRKSRWSYHVLFPVDGPGPSGFAGLVKFDLTTGGFVAYSAGPGWHYNEPGFAPRDDAQSEDDGYLVSLVWNPLDERSEIQVFDCRDARLAAGPVARVLLPRRVPHGFHATFVSARTLARWG